MQLYSPKSKNIRRGNAWRSFELSGKAQSLLVTFVSLVFVAGGTYLFSINKSAVQGYEIRTLEKEMKELKKTNGELKVREAEMRSLSRVEAGSQELRMEKATDARNLSLSNAVALR